MCWKYKPLTRWLGYIIWVIIMRLHASVWAHLDMAAWWTIVGLHLWIIHSIWLHVHCMSSCLCFFHLFHLPDVFFCYIIKNCVVTWPVPYVTLSYINIKVISVLWVIHTTKRCDRTVAKVLSLNWAVCAKYLWLIYNIEQLLQISTLFLQDNSP